MNIYYIFKIETPDDEYLLDYVSSILIKKRYFFNNPIRPCDFLFNYILNNIQKKLYIIFRMEAEHNDCPICYDDLTEYNNVRTNCGHYFCKNCISRVVHEWFLQYEGNPPCPYCRGVIEYYNKFYVENRTFELCVTFYPFIYYHEYDAMTKIQLKIQLRENTRIGW